MLKQYKNKDFGVNGWFGDGQDRGQRGLSDVEGASSLVVLLATYNGGRYLDEQLRSIVDQTYRRWRILVSDDGSTDETREVLKFYEERLGEAQLQILSGPGKGFAANFMALTRASPADADYFAFCDQDDIWHANHLEEAVSWLRTLHPKQPALHCGRTRLIDECGQLLGASPLFPKSPSFHNALVQSLAGGNTMVFNRAARELLVRTGTCPVVSHDWWAYMLVTGAGGVVNYRIEPTVDYRQHGMNLVGANSGLRDRLHRIRRMLSGHFQDWNDINIHALEQNSDLLSEPNRRVLQAFTRARHQPLPMRIREVVRSGVYRQTVLGNLGLVGAAVLGKL